jgi:hypothetical protein
LGNEECVSDEGGRLFSGMCNLRKEEELTE